MSKFASYFTSTGSQVELAYPSMSEMMKDAAAGGYKPVKPFNNTFIHESKNGNKQFIMSNGKENKFIRISPNLDAALLGGEPVKLEESPVYIGKVLNDTKEQIGSFLVIGLSGLRTEEVKFEIGIADYLKAEPANKR